MISDNSLAVLSEIYHQYLEREDLDLPDAKYFDSNFYETTDVFGKPKPNTVYDCLEALNKNGYIKMYIDASFQLEEKGIALMDEKFKGNIKSVIKFITDLLKR